MNRRSFFQALAIGAAAVYLRLAPEKVAVVADLQVDGQLTAAWFQTTRTSYHVSPAYLAQLERIFDEARARGQTITLP